MVAAVPDLSIDADLLELVEQPLKDVTRNEDAYCLGMIDILEAWNGGWAAQGCFLNVLGSLTGFPGDSYDQPSFSLLFPSPVPSVILAQALSMSVYVRTHTLTCTCTCCCDET